MSEENNNNNNNNKTQINQLSFFTLSFIKNHLCKQSNYFATTNDHVFSNEKRELFQKLNYGCTVCGLGLLHRLERFDSSRSTSCPEPEEIESLFISPNVKRQEVDAYVDYLEKCMKSDPYVKLSTQQLDHYNAANDQQVINMVEKLHSVPSRNHEVFDFQKTSNLNISQILSARAFLNENCAEEKEHTFQCVENSKELDHTNSMYICGGSFKRKEACFMTSLCSHQLDECMKGRMTSPETPNEAQAYTECIESGELERCRDRIYSIISKPPEENHVLASSLISSLENRDDDNTINNNTININNNNDKSKYPKDLSSSDILKEIESCQSEQKQLLNCASFNPSRASDACLWEQAALQTCAMSKICVQPLLDCFNKKHPGQTIDSHSSENKLRDFEECWHNNFKVQQCKNDFVETENEMQRNNIKDRK